MTAHIAYRETIEAPAGTLAWLRRHCHRRRDGHLVDRLSRELLADIGLSENGELIEDEPPRRAPG